MVHSGTKPVRVNVRRLLSTWGENLHWKKTAFISAVEWRMRRFNLAKKSRFDRETMVIARFACYILKHAFANESQNQDPQNLQDYTKGNERLQFLSELLLGSTLTHRRAFHRNYVEAHMLSLRRVIDVRKAAAPA